MNDQAPNPYAPSAYIAESDPYSTFGDDPRFSRLAGKSERLGAAIVDGMIWLVICLPILFGVFLGVPNGEELVDSVAGELVGVLLWPIAFLIVNGYLMITRGQTVGKLALKIQVVDFETDRLIGFARIALIRSFWMVPLQLAAVFIPSDLDDSGIGLITLVSVLMIFRQDRRCLHDFLAGSKVVMYRPNRELVS